MVESKEWLSLEEQLKERFGKVPDLQTLLFLIGVQELGDVNRSFNKEEKQDLMHIAVCHLLSLDGYFKLEGRDEEGWPHYTATHPLPENVDSLEAQEELLKQQVIKYFGDEN